MFTLAVSNKSKMIVISYQFDFFSLHRQGARCNQVCQCAEGFSYAKGSCRKLMKLNENCFYVRVFFTHFHVTNFDQYFLRTLNVIHFTVKLFDALMENVNAMKDIMKDSQMCVAKYHRVCSNILQHFLVI